MFLAAEASYRNLINRPDCVSRGTRATAHAGVPVVRGWDLLQQAKANEAVNWLRRAQTAQPDSSSIVLALNVGLVQSGQEEDEARATRARYLGLTRPRARMIAQLERRPDPNLAFASFAESTNISLRRVGMPER